LAKQYKKRSFRIWSNLFNFRPMIFLGANSEYMIGVPLWRKR
jgi:hypothetical protein